MENASLTECWEYTKRLVQDYYANGAPPRETLNEHIRELNNSPIPDALTVAFIRPHLETTEVQFTEIDENAPMSSPAYYHPEEDIMWIHPVGVSQFEETCHAAASTLKTPQARKSFLNYRYHAFLNELSKLPSAYLLIVAVYAEVARILEIAKVVRRRGEDEYPEGQDYLHLLWAFKEMELFIQETKSQDIRSHYGIQWIESEWVLGE